MLCDPADKAGLEATNGIAQIDYISHLVNERKTKEIRESHVLELHRLAVDGIYPCGGRYRDALQKIHIQGSAHQVPEPAFVAIFVKELVDRSNDASDARPAMWRAAYALWRLNWIHPFAGGNGRTSRALAYLILCVDLGMMMPGIPTLPTLIEQRRAEYIATLRLVDASQQDNEDPDLAPMADFVKDAVTRQLAAAIDHLDRG